MKLKLIIIGAFLFVMNNLFAQTAIAPSYGDGSESKPFVIYTIENLKWISEDGSRWNYHYVQMGDIDASATEITGWIPIGYGVVPGTEVVGFPGYYDGQGYTIEHLHGDGLFYVLGGAVSNLGITNCDIAFEGGFALSNLGTITNCFVTGSLVGGGGPYAGGLVGLNGGTITNCYSNVNLSGGMVGGLVGVNSGTITNCFSMGTVTGLYSGGLIWANSGSVTNSYSTAEADNGGLIVDGDSALVANSFWDVETSLQASSPGGGTGKTTAEMKTLSTYTDAGWDFVDETINGANDIWGITSDQNLGYPFLVEKEIPQAYNLLTLIPTDITTTSVTLNGLLGNLNISQYGFCWSELENPTVDDNIIELGNVAPRSILSYNLSGLDGLDVGASLYYRAFLVLDGNIIYSEQTKYVRLLLEGGGTADNPYQVRTLNNLKWISEDGSRWNYHYVQMGDIDASATEITGWIPIGYGVVPGTEVVGFPGYYDGQGYAIEHLHGDGLFYALGGAVSNLGITNCDISFENYPFIGGLALTNYGTITNCFVTGSLVGRVGGIFTGGLVGMNSGTITNCFSNVNISVGLVGGLVGMNSGTITNCFSMGTVTGLYSGGLISANSGSVTNSYSTAEADYAGLIGMITDGGDPALVTNSFWDVETSLQASSPGGGTGKTTAEMASLALAVNYGNNIFLANGWDFKGETTNGSDEIWNIGNGRNNGYPYFNWQYPDDYPSLTMAPLVGEGSSDNPYQIAIWQNLYWITENSSRWNAHYIQTADIDLTAAIPTITAWDSGAGWTPIGNETTKFTGMYDGQDHSIDGLFIDRTGGNQGMFGYTDGATIQNLGLTNINVTSRGGNGIGALTAINYNSSLVDNCYSTGTVTDLVGWATGGLVGDNRENSTISNSYSNCAVNGDGNTGGLVGLNFNGASLINCYSTGNVTCVGDANHQGTGGFVGLNQNAEINKCYSAGDVSGKDNAGGFAGTIYYATVSNSYSMGDVTRASGTNDYYGGFAGYLVLTNTIGYCYSIGSVFESSGVAWSDESKGFVGGEETSNTYTANFFDAEVSNQSTATGATAATTPAMKTNSTFFDEGWSSSIWYMDAETNDNYPYLSWQNSSGSPLPVELVSFTADLSDGNVLLKWATATEVDNYGFEIERTSPNPYQGVGGDVVDGRGWETIGFLEGSGNSNSPVQYSFSDKPTGGTHFQYRLKQIDTDGKFTYSAIVEIEVKPTKFELYQNYPNPFNPTTNIQYQLAENGFVTLKLFDVLGQEVKKLINEFQESGTYEIKLDATGLAGGVYFVQLHSGSFQHVIKMILNK